MQTLVIACCSNAAPISSMLALSYANSCHCLLFQCSSNILDFNIVTYKLLSLPVVPMQLKYLGFQPCHMQTLVIACCSNTAPISSMLALSYANSCHCLLFQCSSNILDFSIVTCKLLSLPVVPIQLQYLGFQHCHMQTLVIACCSNAAPISWISALSHANSCHCLLFQCSSNILDFSIVTCKLLSLPGVPMQLKYLGFQHCHMQTLVIACCSNTAQISWISALSHANSCHCLLFQYSSNIFDVSIVTCKLLSLPVVPMQLKYLGFQHCQMQTLVIACCSNAAQISWISALSHANSCHCLLFTSSFNKTSPGLIKPSLYLNLVMGKFCICENLDADQLALRLTVQLISGFVFVT